jgi:LPPG:FO 2-phospho-L-lactate transferase
MWKEAQINIFYLYLAARSTMITVLAGGTGSAKFVRGLSKIVPTDEITIISNVGDNVELLGLYICPDIDTIMYLFAGLLDQRRGWGVANDTFKALNMLREYGFETWFKLGDKDLATHIQRTFLLKQGKTLSEVTEVLCRSLGVRAKIIPSSNSKIETKILTRKGKIHFQEFWVKRKAKDRVLAVIYEGIEQAEPSPGVIESILEADKIFFSPANPVTSIGPIINVPGVKNALIETKATVVAITPIIGKAPVSGPAGKLMKGLGYDVSPLGVAQIYSDLIDVFVLDTVDARLKSKIEQLGIKCIATSTLMANLVDEKRLAREILEHI